MKNLDHVSKNLDKQEKKSAARSFAVLSGKGGSGKTVITATMAQAFDQAGHQSLIVDADIGTGGMTYYLGVNSVKNTAVGLADIFQRRDSSEKSNTFTLPPGALQPVQDKFHHTDFIGVGDHRRFYHKDGTEELPTDFGRILEHLKRDDRWLIVDCRGGVDSNTISVCQAVDDIFIVAETDATSFQATRHVVNVLQDNELAHKIHGFIINKVVENPATIARTLSTYANSQHLCSIPFDIESARDFLVGDVPSPNSLVGIHVLSALYRSYPKHIPESDGRTWRFEDFDKIEILDFNSTRGGTVIAALIMILLGVLLLTYWLTAPYHNSEYATLFWISISLAVLGIGGTLESTRKLAGLIFGLYERHAKQTLLKRLSLDWSQS